MLATSPIDMGIPRGEPLGPRSVPAGNKDGLGSPGNGPGSCGRLGGNRFPRGRAEKPRKRAGLGQPVSRAFGSEAELLLISEFGGLVTMMVVSIRTAEQSGNESPQYVRQVHVQVPEE